MSSREKQLSVLLFLIMADCDLVIVGQDLLGGACICFRPILTAVLKDSRQEEFCHCVGAMLSQVAHVMAGRWHREAFLPP